VTSASEVRRLLDAARRVVEARAALAAELTRSTGLSPEGVELGLTQHLEIDAKEEELAQLLAAAARVATSRVSVVLSANVFVGALRAIAFARAAAPLVVVRPSGRDPAFARALVLAADDPTIVLDEELDVAAVTDGEIHVYGRDASIAAIRARARVPVRGHGSGMGIALVSSAADPSAAARDVAADVVPFDQRGCLSPRIVLVEGDAARAAGFAEAIHAELDRAERSVPRGVVSSSDRAAAAQYVATMTFASRALVGAAHAIGIAPDGAPLLLPPPSRHVHVAPVARLEDAASLVAPLARGVTAIGCDDLACGAALAAGLGITARLSRLGRMQRPALDGPVDLRDH
jgi:hypothetical protein